jgi:mycofactocin system creatininase family protein
MAGPLGERTWEEVAAHPGRLLAVPLGATEQHGPHLPLDTDTRVALALARSLADRRSDVLVAPALAYGSSGEHAGFAGTVSIGQAAVEILELARGLGAEFRGLVLVCAHGGNAEPLARAARRAAREGRPVLAWPSEDGLADWAGHDPRRPSDLHAGWAETSIMLHLHPELVRLDRAAPGGPANGAGLIDHLRRGGVRAVSSNGVLGDPAGASATDGEALLRRLGDDLARAVERSFPP